jgi:hypothetical protein
MTKINKKAVISILSCILIASVIFLSACSFSGDNKSSVSSTTEGSVSQTISIDNDTESVNASSEAVEVACPRNNSCSYPGKCEMYIDSNNNALCDLGE